jgi:3'(2'), 5'-bisphosphate nucleotidase
MTNVDIQKIIEISRAAGLRVMAIYHEVQIDVSKKADNSPLTQADMESNAVIVESLNHFYPSIPVISEEASVGQDYQLRKNWDTFFLVDPLDGTKEFISRNGEFTINIALVKQGRPVLGVVYAPALDVLYYAEHGQGAYKIQKESHIKLVPQRKDAVFRVVTSRSHSCEKTNAFLAELKSQGKQVATLSSGSALKFGLIAEGTANIYPRFTPTMEWDTAAGHVLINEVGKKLTLIGSDDVLQYNKSDLRNPGFIVHG